MGGVPFLLALLIIAGIASVVAFVAWLIASGAGIAMLSAIVHDIRVTKNRMRHNDQQRENEMIARQAGAPYVRKPFDGH